MAQPTRPDDWDRLHPENTPLGMQGGPGALSGSEQVRYAPRANGHQFREVLDILLRGKWLILGITLLVLVPTLFYTLSLPYQYRSYALLRLEQQQDSGLSGLFSPRGARGLGSTLINNELLVLRQSLPLAQRAADSLLALSQSPGFDTPLTILSRGDGRTLPAPVVARRLQGGYTAVAAEGGDVDALRIWAFSTVPEEAEVVANVYAQAYIQQTQEASRASVVASRQFLENQVERRAAQLATLDNQVREFMIREGAIALDQESGFVVSQLANLEALVDDTEVEAQLTRATLESLEAELADIRPNLATRIASGIDQDLQAALQRKAELELELEQIYLRSPELRNQPATGELLDLRQQLERLQARLDAIADQYVEDLIVIGGTNPAERGLAQAADLQRQIVERRIQLDGLAARRAVLDDRIANYEQQLRTIPRQAIELAQLQRARTSTEQAFLLLNTRLQELRIQEEAELGYAELIRPAVATGVPFSPDRRRNILLGLLAGLGLGIAVAVARVRLDNRIHRPGELSAMGYSVLGTIPDMSKLVKDDFEGRDTVEVDGRSYSTRLVALLNPLSTIAEAYRGVRTNVQFSRPDTEVQTVLVTSPNPTEGKSVTAINLAIVMAQAGRRVLLVDADLRRPTVHAKLGRPKEPGLRELLFADAPLAPEALRTDIEDLYVLTSGAGAPNPSELLGSKRMRDLIEAFKAEFDLVLFDVPPVLAATDAVLLSTQCEATLLVVSAGHTKTYEVDQAAQALRSVGAQLIGTLLNGFEATKAGGYGYRYGYSTYYGHKPPVANPSTNDLG